MSEAKEQEALLRIAQYNPVTREYLIKITNEGKRHPIAGYKLKQQGLKPGVSDVFLSYPCGQYHGLYIELKRREKSAKPTKQQLEWIEKVRAVGYAAYVAHGWQEAWAIISNYLKQRTMTNIKIESSMQITSVNYSSDNHQWQITMHGTEWPWMMKLAKPLPKCPDCKTTKLRKDGKDTKSKQVYECLNPQCKRTNFNNPFY